MRQPATEKFPLRLTASANDHGGDGPRTTAAVAPWEWIGLLLILAAGAWLRLSHLELLEFQRDEAHALELALQWLRAGNLPLAGLVSSTGVTNPPLFVYLIAPLVAISHNPVEVSGGMALLNVAAVGLCWYACRRYSGAVCALVAAAMFAVSPWAVIFSRKIWAQDLIPLLATATLWAVSALCLGRRKRAIFWVACLPLALAQIHFAGLALVATIAVILLVLRPTVDWRYAVAGVAVPALLLLPYLKFQWGTDWADFKLLQQTVRGLEKWEQVQALLPGATVDPNNGLRLPSRRMFRDALAIMNGGRIEDQLGISADAEHDPKGVWVGKAGGGKSYFSETLTLGDWLLGGQQVWFIAALAWFVAVAIRSVARWRGFQTDAERLNWIAVLWVAVPLGVFALGRVWVFLPYFVILYPIYFVASGLLAARLMSFKHSLWWVAPLAVVAMLVGNVVYLNDYYRFVGQNGGAQGSQGTGLGYKQAAAAWLAERGGVRLQQESRTQIALAISRDPAERVRLAAQLSQPTLLQLNSEDRARLPELEWPWLIAQAAPGSGQLATNTAVLIVDGNREALQPEQLEQLQPFERVTFGPVQLYVTKW